MNRILAFVVVVAFVVTLGGCSSGNKHDQERLHGLCDFSKIGDIPDFGGYHHSLYYDTTTGVIYMLTYGLNVNSYVPLFNADGTLKIWKGCEME